MIADSNPASTCPATVEAAVSRLLLAVSADVKAQLSASDESVQRYARRNLGQYIRNEFGLWNGNQPLLKATGCRHPDDASAVILDAFQARHLVGK
jgi:hypothetical protein